MTTQHFTQADSLSRVVAFFNGKGGVGKTSSVANVAGQLASKYSILIIDLDTQGNLGLNFGYRGGEDDDEGMAVVEAIQEDSALAPPVKGVRENIDIYPGGKRLKRMSAIEMSGETPQGVARSFAEKLATVADDYDLIFIDCPPGNQVLQQMALAAARYVLIPVDSDPASWDGITEVGPLVSRARRENPDLTYLGAFLFAHPIGATRLLKNTKIRLNEVSDRIPLFDTAIRYSKAAAHDCRVRGQLIHELAGDVDENGRAVLEALKGREDGKKVEIERLAGSAGQLSDDYRELAKEMLRRIGAHEETVPISQAGR